LDFEARANLGGRIGRLASTGTAIIGMAVQGAIDAAMPEGGIADEPARMRGSRGDHGRAAEHGEREGKGGKCFCDIHVIILYL
jgi:hypothetical protein